MNALTGTRVLVVGSGFGGLATACYLADAGADVTVLEQHETLGGRASVLERDGFRFDMGPSWYLMPDVFERFFGHFDRAPADFYGLERLDPHYRIFFKENEGDRPSTDAPGLSRSDADDGVASGLDGDVVDITADREQATALFEAYEDGAGDDLDLVAHAVDAADERGVVGVDGGVDDARLDLTPGPGRHERGRDVGDETVDPGEEMFGLEFGQLALRDVEVGDDRVHLAILLEPRDAHHEPPLLVGAVTRVLGGVDLAVAGDDGADAGDGLVVVTRSREVVLTDVAGLATGALAERLPGEVRVHDLAVRRDHRDVEREFVERSTGEAAQRLHHVAIGVRARRRTRRQQSPRRRIHRSPPVIVAAWFFSLPARFDV